jgi:hypothetical protein
MAWNTTLVTIVRNLINDPPSDSQKYDDGRIQEAVVIGGLLSAQDFEYEVEYIFDIDTPEISPDPTLTATLDRVAMALFTLKAACILTMNDYQSATGSGIRVRDGDSEVDTTGSFKGYKDIITLGPCGSYDKLINSLNLKSAFGKGKAIMTPVNERGFYGGGGIWSSARDFYDSFIGY